MTANVSSNMRHVPWCSQQRSGSWRVDKTVSGEKIQYMVTCKKKAVM